MRWAPSTSPTRRGVIAWLDVDEERPGTDLVHVADPENPVVRVSRGSDQPDPSRHQLTVELRHDVAADAIEGAALHGLRQAGLISESAAAKMIFAGAMPTFDAPTADTRERFAAAQGAFAELELDALVVGGAAGAGADSFNEQVVQGLAAAQELA